MRRAEEPPIDVQALEGERVEVARHREPLARLVLRQRRPRSRPEQAIDRTGVIAEIAKRALANVGHETQMRKELSDAYRGLIEYGQLQPAFEINEAFRDAFIARANEVRE